MPIENYEYNQENGSNSNKSNDSYDRYKGYNPLTSGETSISEKDQREAEELLDSIQDNYFGIDSDPGKWLITDTTDLNLPKMSDNDVQKFKRVRDVLTNIMNTYEGKDNQKYDYGSFIAAVQVYLNILDPGHNGIILKQDGLLGNETKDAIRSFQRSVGLVSDGIPGRDTINELLNSVDYVRGNNNSNPSEENNPIIGIRIVNSSL